MLQSLHRLAQLPGIEADAGTAARRPMSFSDLQQGLRTASHTTPQDRSTQVYLVLMVLAVVVLGVVLHLRQRRKLPIAISSPARLGRDLARHITFPFGTRVMMFWVARTVKLPVAALFLSSHLFDTSLQTWSQQPTFTPVRQWGLSRLLLLKPHLFDN